MSKKRKYPARKRDNRLDITNLPDGMKETLEIICENLGTNISQVMKQQARRFINETPENLKQRRAD